MTARAATCCPAPDGRLYAIDHGVTFNVDDKLRTLLWGWAGEPLPGEAVEVLERPGRGTGRRRAARRPAGELITASEVAALRATGSAAAGARPAGTREPSGDWPAIPWPPVVPPGRRAGPDGRPAAARSPPGAAQDRLTGQSWRSGSYPERASGYAHGHACLARF